MRGADYVIRRAGFALLTIFIAITINFFLFRVLPGNVVSDLARVPHATPQLRHALTVQFGLDRPKWEQYLIYLRELARGNMGISFATQQPVSRLLLNDLKNTIPMVTIGTLGAIAVGIATASCLPGAGGRRPTMSAPTSRSRSTRSRPSSSA